MAIKAAVQLTTAWDPGDFDAGKSYTHVAVTRVAENTESNSVQVQMTHGYLDAGVFVVGLKDPKQFAITNVSGGTAHYDNMVAKVPVGGENLMAGYQGIICQWMADEGHYPGTVVLL